MLNKLKGRETKYYKATRLNGTDFFTGTVLYEVGKRTTHPTSKQRKKDDPASYLSVSTTPTECTGLEWPCRLFKVRGVGKAMTHSQLPNKRAFLSVDVVEELPAHMVFGPQGKHVVTLLERAKRLTKIEVLNLVAAWNAARYAAWDATRNAALYASRNVAGNAARYASWTTAGYAAWDAARYTDRDAAKYAGKDATLALVVRDLIGLYGFTQEHYDALTLPWRKTIGPIHPDDYGLADERYQR